MTTTTTIDSPASSPGASRLNAMTDEAILLEYRQSGDQDLFSELVHRYERELYDFLYRRFENATVAEDAFQTAFLQVHMKCGQFEEGRRFRPWLFTIAMNSAIDLIRRTRRRHAMASLNAPIREHEGLDAQLLDMLTCPEPSPDERLDRQERCDQCRKAVTRLPDRIKIVVELVFFQGLQYREVAELLSIPIGTVKSRLHEAVVKLRTIWRQEFENREMILAT